jgi:hypothetical protein
MKVLIIGASNTIAEAVKALAPASSDRTRPLHVVLANGSPLDGQRADWALVANAQQRALAIDQLRLPSYRVIELPALASMEELERERESLSVALMRMAEIGVARPFASPLMLRLADVVVRFWKRTLERNVEALRARSENAARAAETVREALVARRLAERNAIRDARAEAERQTRAAEKMAGHAALRLEKTRAKKEAKRQSRIKRVDPPA